MVFSYSAHIFIIPVISTVITREENYYLALCLELDIPSQGGSVEESFANLNEAISLYFEDEDAEVPRTRSFR